MRRPRLVASALAAVASATTALAQERAFVVPGAHDALLAAGPQAARIGALWNLTVFICTAVFCAVLIALVFALWRSGRTREDEPADLSSIGRHERGPYLSVVWSVGVSIALLFVLIVASVVTDRALARASLDNAVRIDVTGHQWWWELTYRGESPGDNFSAVNELHVPVGRPVVLRLNADDVIHSLWVPSLAGKKDLIPGRTATMSFRADRPGRYRGQCAEFCGYQHAFMAFEVIADAPEQYDAWAATQRRPAAEPADATAQRGRDVFLGSTCIMCHAIDGTTAAARKGPDLTHVGGRSTIAAGTLPNRPGELARWIANPHDFKPGVNMPATALSSDDMSALVSYLGGLK
ncbi:MAG TPA: cytochrome c oxidase subunit II [Caldimonas sp.]|nr:cytochrome c oxidase subunit II [Caldimonas sp.]